jgi:2-keto-4-pentenoate hydratase/2-oxohepta-3-ene-1,7-dioic acid hydratase in catechol pathway
MEIDRWIKPGDEVEVALDGVGTLRNPIGNKGEPA